jgi:hypothetical protein
VNFEVIRTNKLTILRGYYNTWTEEVPDISETDDDLTATDVATEDSVSDISPRTEPNIEFGASTGGLDFMSSSGYPQIEYAPSSPHFTSDAVTRNQQDIVKCLSLML